TVLVSLSLHDALPIYFVAEQLMLMVSDEVFKVLNTGKAIDFIKKNYLADLPDDPQWVDGSGLSRHNLASPRTMVALAEKIYRLRSEEHTSELQSRENL